MSSARLALVPSRQTSSEHCLRSESHTGMASRNSIVSSRQTSGRHLAHFCTQQHDLAMLPTTTASPCSSSQNSRQTSLARCIVPGRCLSTLLANPEHNGPAILHTVAIVRLQQAEYVTTTPALTGRAHCCQALAMVVVDFQRRVEEGEGPARLCLAEQCRQRLQRLVQGSSISVCHRLRKDAHCRQAETW